MIQALAILLLFQLVGEIIVQIGKIPVPGPVIGMALLFVALLARGGAPQPLRDTSRTLLSHLSLLFVPAGAGIMLHLQRVEDEWLAIVLALLAGSLTAITSAMALTWLLGGTPRTVLSMAPKSVTTPIAMGIAEKIGGLPSLTAVLVIMTGIVGAVAAPTVLGWLKVDDDGVKGFAIGVASHGIGTARAFQISELAGAFSGLAMGLNALLTALLAPVVVRLLGLG